MSDETPAAPPLTMPPTMDSNPADVTAETVVTAPVAPVINLKEPNITSTDTFDRVPCNWDIVVLDDDQIQASCGPHVFHGTRKEFSALLRS